MNTPMIFAQAAAPAAPAVQAAAPSAPATPAPVTATEVQPAGADAPQVPQPQQGGFMMPVMMLLLIALFYVMMIRPQQRKEKERRKMIDELRAGKKVIFAGGLMGKIVEAKEKTFKIEIAGDVVIEVARAAVQTVVEETPETK